jgi:hypothetical protein
MKIIVRNAKNDPVFEFETADAPYRFTMTTIHGNKEYELRFGHPREEGVKNKEVVTGVQLQGVAK